LRTIAVIPAAGLGARFHELGKRYPKCLLPYKGKTLLEATLDQITKQTDIQEIFIGIRPEDAEHPLFTFVKERAQKLQLTFVPVVNTPLRPPGPATTLLYCLEAAKLDGFVPVLMVLSDSLFTGLDLSKFTRTDAMSVMEVQDQSRWCMVRNVDGWKTTFYDKPATAVPSTMAVSGVYSFQNSIMLRNCLNQAVEDAARAEKEPQFYPAISQYLKMWQSSMSLLPHLPDDIVDVGTLEQFLKLNNTCAPRAFNTLIMDRKTVTKTSRVKPEKIVEEAAWYLKSPIWAQTYFPRIYNINTVIQDGPSYTMERIQGHNLRYLALYYDKSYTTWRKIFKDLKDFSMHCRLTETVNRGGTFWRQVLDRSYQRVAEANAQVGSLFLFKLSSMLGNSGLEHKTSYYHGDLHFSNIFWNYTQDGVKMIDPRGELQGHWLYDIAKLAHSVIGNYDYIEEDLYVHHPEGVIFYNKGNEEIKRAFYETFIADLPPMYQEFVLLLCAGFFVTMIPLHKDNPEHCELFLQEYQRLLHSTWAKL
jgi:dTDP-glucose pyrophosphorylase